MRSFKHLVCFAVLTLVLAVTNQSQARDPGDAWPWGSEMPFPWKGIKGTWLAESNGLSTYFTFRTVHTADGVNQLQVRQYDSKTCQLLATGAGYEEDRVVKAVLLTPHGVYELTVHVFRESDIRDRVSRLIAKSIDNQTVTVMNISSLASADPRLTLELEKVNMDPAGVCK